ncbi:maleylpyruvate isomerase family mycothiol-dependent enzyme [Jatrophihabitans sp. YIM 134969]
MDEIAQWQQAQDRVIGLVAERDDAQASVRVPACPDWTAKDLLAHMVGLGADVVAGDEPDDHNPAWTQAQVDARRDRDLAALVAEWQGLTGPLVQWMTARGTRPLNDVVIHEQDLRGALEAPGAEENEGLETVRDRMAGRFGPRVGEAGLPAIALVSPAWECVAGDGPVAVVLEASGFDLFRALTARRSAAQISSWVVEGDVRPYLPLFAGIGALPETDLTI